MIEVEALRPSVNALYVINWVRLDRTIDESRLPPAPATALAVPTETARNEVNQAAAMPALIAPTRDGIFAIGPTAVKVGDTIAISGARSFNSWGF